MVEVKEQADLIRNIHDLQRFQGKLICYVSKNVQLTSTLSNSRACYGYLHKEEKVDAKKLPYYSIDKFFEGKDPSELRYISSKSIFTDEIYMRECTNKEKDWLQEKLEQNIY